MIGTSTQIEGARTSLRSRQLKSVAAIPVAGATVVAPLQLDATNYGSAGGAFTTRGAPTYSRKGVQFDGVDDSLHLDGLSSANFSLVFRGAIQVDNNPFNTALVNAMTASVGNTTWRGWGVERYGGWFTILTHGVARTNSTVVGDALERTFALVRSSGTSTLYIDGASVASNASAQTLGDRLLLGSSFRTDFQSWVRGYVRNLALYPSALSAPNRALVEAWAAL